MPYIRPFAGGYAHCAPSTRGAFLVSDATVSAWDAICVNQPGVRTPTNHLGYRLRCYPALDVASHRPYAASGVYVDHSDPAVEQAAYEMRDRLLRQQAGTRQEVLQTIASRLGLRHWRDAYNATRNVGRRHTGESGRNANGELVWRRWSNRYSAAATARATASPFRAYGIEIEFGRPGESGNAAIQRRIYAAMVAAGIDTLDRWGSWHRANGVPGWHCTHDSTVAGEIISDIMDGSAASRDEVAAVLRIVRDNGGFAWSGQGMHVHHDVRDFTTADKVRLVDNIAACQDALLAFVGSRIHSGWCRPMTPSQFTMLRRDVAAGGAGSNDHSIAWNFGHINGRGSIEFRGLGNTLNGRKVRAWIQAGQALLTATKAGVTFPQGTTVTSMLAVLRGHGMSAWAAGVFATRCGVAAPVAA